MLTCQNCGEQLQPFTRRQVLLDKKGRQEYHTHDMARWLAGTDGRLAEVTNWSLSARASKAGLVTGYDYQTGEFGADGLGIYCERTMACLAKAATAKKAAAAGPARTLFVAGHETGSDPGLSASRPASKKAPPGECSGRRLQQIRERVGMSRAAFAASLGIAGKGRAGEIAIYRFERGARAVPITMGRLAFMYERHGPPQWRATGKKKRGRA